MKRIFITLLLLLGFSMFSQARVTIDKQDGSALKEGISKINTGNLNIYNALRELGSKINAQYPQYTRSDVYDAIDNISRENQSVYDALVKLEQDVQHVFRHWEFDKTQLKELRESLRQCEERQ